MKIISAGDCWYDMPTFESPLPVLPKGTKPHKNSSRNFERPSKLVALFLAKKRRATDSHMIGNNGGLKPKNGHRNKHSNR